MVKFSKAFFDNEVLFIGVTARYNRFCTQVFKALAGKGITAFPVSREPKDAFDFPVYANLGEVPRIPVSAYIITDREETAAMIDELHGRGVRKILFNSRNVVDEETLKKCRDLGIETAIACPLMLYGRGLHRVHGFFAGVK